jgi:hypothetical protein
MKREKFPVSHELYVTLKPTLMWSLLIRIKGEPISKLKWLSFTK